MDSLKSFKGYGKMDPAEDREFRRKTKIRLILIAIAVVLLIAIVAGVATSVSFHKRKTADKYSPQSPISASSSIKAVCSVTRYPDSCFASISSAASNSSTVATDPVALFQLSLSVASHSISKISPFLSTLKVPTTDIRLQAAINDCKELLDDAVDRLNDSTAIFTTAKPRILSDSKIDDLKTWLSTAITDLETCLDGFEGTADGLREKLVSAMVNSTQFASNSLAIVTGILGIMKKLHFPVNRKLLGATRQSRVLFAGETEANVTVANDGWGKVRSIQEAVNMVPNRSVRPFVIYVKEGEYEENVVVDKNKWNVVLVGDGMYKTIITGSKNFIDGTPTFSTATFAVTGRGFVAKDIGFKNTAGAEKHQAVALRSGSDRSIFYRCSFDAFQDTLYAHSNRQFYRDCDIIGTVDFIFGNAAVVFQNCKILPRQPLPNQANTITAQGRKDPNQNTGISIQGCTVAPYDAVNRPTFLGRPWKNYSTAVIMKSEIGAVVDPKGWMPWVFGTVPPETVRFAEFQNTGAGASVAGRVTWPGYRPAIDADEASKYAVGSFLGGHEWIPETGVQFDANL